MPLLVLLLACPAATDDTAWPDSSGPPPDLEEADFSIFEPWASPIDDYIAAGEEALGHSDFLQGIHDLTVFSDRLLLGYGDANLNLGRITPIEVRAYTDPAAAEPVVEATLDEEQVSRYRRAEDTLWIPGVDATEDAFLGNVFRREDDGSWTKSRTLDQGIHVHDVAATSEGIWACGSGGTPEDYDAVQLASLLWRSDDSGETFGLVEKLQNPGVGDARFTSLLALDDEVYAFGYRTDSSFSIDTFLAWRMQEGTFEDWPTVGNLLVQDTISIDESLGLLNGLLVASSIQWRVYRATSDGIERVEALDDRTLISAEPLGDGRVLLLWIEGDEYGATPDPYRVGVGLTHDGIELIELTKFQHDVAPTSAAAWGSDLYLGMPDGTIWRSLGE